MESERTSGSTGTNMRCSTYLFKCARGSELQITDRVTTVREKRDLLIQLEPLRFPDLIQPPFRFGI
jgi:hypothetical protein